MTVSDSHSVSPQAEALPPSSLVNKDWIYTRLSQGVAASASLRKSLLTEFYIVYDIDAEGDSWNFPLLHDLKKGDVIIL